jgi:hypothetical protein
MSSRSEITIQNSWAIELLDAFRSHYRRFVASVHEAVINSADSIVLRRLGDDITEYTNLVHEVSILPLFHRLYRLESIYSTV